LCDSEAKGGMVFETGKSAYDKHAKRVRLSPSPISPPSFSFTIASIFGTISTSINILVIQLD
jgi:hypothetical protein